MKVKLIKIIFIFGLIYFLQPLDLLACTCEEPPSVYKKVDDSQAVFSGKVVAINIDGKSYAESGESGRSRRFLDKERIYRFQVFESFKGKKEKFLDVNLGDFNPSCESGFTVGESYLMFAYKNEDEDLLSDGPCTRSLNLEDAVEQIEIIREKLAGKPEAKIYGSIGTFDNLPNSLETKRTILPNQIVILQSEQKRFETKTDKRGIFKFFGNVPDGNYKLFPEIKSNDFVEESIQKKVRIENGKIISTDDYNLYYEALDSVFIEFSLLWNNGVDVNVFDGEGNPLKTVAVRLIPVEVPFIKIESDYSYDSAKDGNFFDSYITPGQYYLVAEIYAPFGNKDKLRIFYPRSETPEKATPIEIKSTSKLNFDMILPEKYVLREIKGNVFWSDGLPTEFAEIRLFKTENHIVKEYNDEIENTGYIETETDESGNFSFWGFENAEYWIHFKSEFEIPSENEDDEDQKIEVKGKPFKIKIGKDNQPLKLTLVKP